MRKGLVVKNLPAADTEHSMFKNDKRQLDASVRYDRDLNFIKNQLKEGLYSHDKK